MAMLKPAAMVEELKYTTTDQGCGKAKFTLNWKKVSASVAVTVK
jgi:hypothetical protein